MNSGSLFRGQVILIIDDTPANLKIISNYLEGAGFEIAVAQDGIMGLEIARRILPDLILLDVLMPEMDGFEVCRRLKATEATRDIPVIFMTSLAEMESKITGFEVGGVDYITKPVQIDEVLARVKTHLTLRAVQKQLAGQNSQLQQEILMRQGAEEDLRQAQVGLERRVTERTAELARANASLKDEIAERERAEIEIQRRNRELTLLNRVIAASVNEVEADNILAVACRELAQAFEIPRAVAALLNETKTEAIIVAEYLANDRPSVLGQTIPLTDDSSAQHVLTRQIPFIVDDVQNGPQAPSLSDSLRQHGIISVLIVPLIFEETVLGILGLGSIESRYFLDEEVNLAQSVASQVSGVLARLRLDLERRRWEAQYYQAQKMEALGRLTGGVAHDFNNILTVILGNSSMLLQSLNQGHPFRQEIEQIRQSAERAATLIRQLLAFSRQQILQPSILNINDIIVNLEKMLRRVIGEDIDLVTILEPQLGQVTADAGQIEQVIMNLVVNARDAMPEGGRLIIETANIYLDEMYSRQSVGVVAGPYVVLAVSDTGVGVDAETHARIFDPFFTTKPQGKGTGLGLATAHGIINQSGGHIWVYSEPGKGATFKIYLPRVESTAGLVRPKQVSVKPGRGWETIVLVEDEEMVRELTQQILVGEGYTVLKAKDSKEAHQRCIEHNGPIHLLLTDVIIPGGQSGVQLAHELTALYPKIKVLYMSGYTHNTIVHHGVLDPDVAFLPKPFTLNGLTSKVREVLDAS